METKPSPARVFLKSPRQKWLLRGGVAASFLPILCSIVLVIIANLVIYIATPVISNLVLFVIPTTGTILATYLGIHEIRKKNPRGFSGKGSFVWIALKSGFFAHWIIAACLFFLILLIGGINLFGNGLYIFLKTIALGSYFAFLLWGLLTLPLSLMCGYIFWLVAVRSSDNLIERSF